MRKLILKILMLFAGLFFVQQTFAQQMLTGRIADGNGDPIPGVNVIIKGTTKGTISDLNGIYNIEVFTGDVLVISFVGMRSREIEITEQSFQQLSYRGGVLNSKKKRERKKIIPRYYTDPVNAIAPVENKKGKNRENGVAYLNENENRIRKYKGKRSDYGTAILQDIIYDDSLKTYTFNFERPFKQRTERFEFNSIIVLDRITQLPDLQTSYSSGTVQTGQFVYTSPTENNFLSWGPKLSLLEYDGQSSSFYKGGNIVGQGNGNGEGLSVFQPSGYFKTGFRLVNSLEYRITESEKYIYAKYSNASNAGVMPGATLKGHDFTLGMKSNRFETRAFFSWSKGERNLHEGNYSRILYALYTAPPEFDNANGFSTKEAFNNSSSYLTLNDIQRSYNSNSLENPYWLAANDPSKNESIRYGLSASYNNEFSDEWEYRFSAAFQKEENENIIGAVSFYAPDNGWLNEKADNNINFKAQAGLEKSFDLRIFNLNNFVRYLFKYEGYEFERNNYVLSYAFPSSIDRSETLENFTQTNNRSVHEISIGQYKESSYRNFPLLYSASLNIYNSSTSSRTYFLPSVSLGLATYDIDGWFGDFFPGKVYFAWSKSLKEADFQNRPNHYNTVNYGAAEFGAYHEAKNVYFNEDLKPLKTDNFTGRLSFWNIGYQGIELFFDYYHRESEDAFFPTQNNDNILVENLANITNKGIEAGVSYRFNRYQWSFKSAINFSKNTNKVDQLLNGDDIIPIAGFSDVYKSLIEGEQVGVIIGSRYLRNDAGQLIIGNEGYPLVDPNLGIIGNPNPDWTLNFNNTISWRRFDLGFNLEYKHGGQVWNGTKNVLNYHGVSTQAAGSRNINNYIFEGVNQNGEPNTIAVDFANPANPINEFRYLRYGYTGVAEDAIEDASWFRLKKVTLSYEFRRIESSWISISGLKLSCWIENAITVTPYSGVDPQSSLFGYEEAQGLDMFNAPSTRRFGFNLNVTF